MCSRRHSRRWSRRFPNRDELLETLEERQKDLEQEVADIADLIRRLRDESRDPTPGEPQPATI
jgi:hypothetical protein